MTPHRGLTVALALLLAFATMGAEGCETGGFGTDADTTSTPTFESPPPEEPPREDLAPETTDEEPPPDDSGGGCEAGYDPCVPPYPPDLDCADVGPVTVTGSDPHGLDADGDGEGCEAG